MVKGKQFIYFIIGVIGVKFVFELRFYSLRVFSERDVISGLGTWYHSDTGSGTERVFLHLAPRISRELGDRHVLGDVDPCLFQGVNVRVYGEASYVEWKVWCRTCFSVCLLSL